MSIFNHIYRINEREREIENSHSRKFAEAFQKHKQSPLHSQEWFLQCCVFLPENVQLTDYNNDHVGDIYAS